jgi:SNF2 family DNA or RNA helicase
MNGHLARIVLAPQEGKISVQPEGNVSLRQIERLLQSAELLEESIRSHGRLYLDITVLDRLLSALGSHAHVTSEVVEAANKIAKQEASISRARSVIKEISCAGMTELLPDFPEKSRLDPHQVQAVAIATHPDVLGICLFDEQGLGKTIEALFIFHRLRQLGEVSRMLIVCPKSMAYEWIKETHQFFGGLYTTEAVMGTDREKRRTLDRLADIYVTNFETATSLSDRLKNLLKANRGKALLVIDESFFVKNPGAYRTKALSMLRAYVQRCVVLCGTPAPNSPFDLVEQFNIADGGMAFRGISVPDDPEAARSVIKQVIDTRGVYLRRLKEQVLPDLPPRTFNRILVPLEPQQFQIYLAALKNFVQDLLYVDEVSFRRRITSFMARRTTLLQICSYPAAVVNSYSETPAKLLALDSILDELITKQREKVIVWSFFTASIEAIYNRYAQYKPVRFDGKVSNSQERRDSVLRFQQDDETMLFVGNPAAAGAGLTLHRARISIYESMSNQAAHYLQSLDRIHRRGQSRPVEYIVLICDQTLEVNEYDRLLKKQAMAHDLLDDQVSPPLTRQTMLDEAISALRTLGISDEPQTS